MLSLCSGYPSAGLDMGAWRDDRLLRNRQDTFVSCHVVARMRNVLRTCSLLAMGLRDMDKIYFLSHRFSDFITPCAKVKARLGLRII